MGNICSKTVLNLPSKESFSLDKLESTPEFELIYMPKTGEGESLKALFKFLNISFKESVQCRSPQVKSKPSTTPILLHAESKIEGNLASIRYICKLYGLYPPHPDSYKVEEICEMINEEWEKIKVKIYDNHKNTFDKFCMKTVPKLMNPIINGDLKDIPPEQTIMCDIYLATFLTTFFYRHKKYMRFLDTKVKRHYQRFISSSPYLKKYFNTHKFILYL